MASALFIANDDLSKSVTSSSASATAAMDKVMFMVVKVYHKYKYDFLDGIIFILTRDEYVKKTASSNVITG